MSREEVITILTPLAQVAFRRSDLIITDDLSGQNLETWTSLAFTQFIGAVEKQFGFKFKLVELFTLRNMGAIIDSIVAHVS